MTRGQKITNLIGVTIPFAGFLASVFFLWGSYVTWRDLTIFAVGYALTTLGISIGFHRLFTHRSYETYQEHPLRPRRARLDGRAGPGDPLGLRPPQAPQLRRPRGRSALAARRLRPGIRGKIAGLWHAHVGWLFRNVGRAEWTKYAKDLLADRGMVFISRMFPLWVAAVADAPFAAGWIWGGTFGAGPAGHVLGRPDPDLPAPPHHVVGQLGLPLRRLAPVPGQGRVAQRLVALLDLVRRVVASQPSRLPLVGVPRPEALGARHRRARDPAMRRLGLVWKVNVPTAEMQNRRRELFSAEMSEPKLGRRRLPTRR